LGTDSKIRDIERYLLKQLLHGIATEKPHQKEALKEFDSIASMDVPFV